MQLFKKKKEDARGLFELPELPGFPEMREIKEALKPREEAIPPLPALPSAPQYPIQAQQLQRPDIRKTEEIGSAFAQLTREIMPVQTIMSRPSYQRPEEINEEQVQRGSKQREPIFVKIDKFNDALNNFEAIKQKISEIDSLLKKVKETRTKEQEEIDSWEREVEEIMSKVNNIDQKLFNKLD